MNEGEDFNQSGLVESVFRKNILIIILEEDLK
jgi:hypothetical protein